jgi:hypothetical protein
VRKPRQNASRVNTFATGQCREMTSLAIRHSPFAIRLQAGVSS